MSRCRRQQGSTLILVIGVVAALAVFAAALVGLTGNMRHATSTEVTQVKAFNVAEAGIDAGQQALWLSWPTPMDDGTPPTPLPSVDLDTFRTSFPSSSYPDPVSGEGDFIDVGFYDDDGNQDNWGIRREFSYDENKNGYMWIESRGATGPRAAKVMALVQKVMYEPVIMDNVVFATSGILDVRGSGSDFVIGLDYPATSASIYSGTYEPSGGPDFQAGVSLPVTGATDDTIDQIFPDEMLLYLIGVANGAGKEYATAADVPPEAWSSKPRIIVIDSDGLNLNLDNVPDTDTDTTTGDGTIWSATNPGMLIILSGDLNNTGSNRKLYGLVYLNAGLILGGNAEIHGMVVAKTIGWLHGTRSIFYSPYVMDFLTKPVTLSVKLVPNTWRELPAN